MSELLAPIVLALLFVGFGLIYRSREGAGRCGACSGEGACPKADGTGACAREAESVE
jgi:hypothetical protein